MGKKILIVEDEDLIVKVLSIRLENLGYAVLTASDGEAGLAAAKKERPDLALIDLGLPKLDGGALCRLIKSDGTLKHMKVIMLTGRAAGAEESVNAGADLYVGKPYEWEHLRVQLQKLLA